MLFLEGGGLTHLFGGRLLSMLLWVAGPNYFLVLFGVFLLWFVPVVERLLKGILNLAAAFQLRVLAALLIIPNH